MTMKTKHFSTAALLATMLLFMPTGAAISQLDEIDQAREASGKAQSLADQKQWNAAIALLQENLGKCSVQEAGQECRTILNFTLGYVCEQWSNEGGRERRARLEMAADHYQKALEDQPQNVQIMNNLALTLRSLGDWQQVVATMTQAAELSPDMCDAYWIEIGDMYRENGLLSDALRHYQRAAESNPSNQTPHWRILNLYRSLPEEKLTDLFQYSKHLNEINHPELAKEGFEQVIQRSFRSDPGLAEDALLEWAEVCAAEGWIGKQSLQNLPSAKEWPSPAMEELHELVVNPQVGENRLRWWRQNESRRHVAASVMKAVGDDLLLSGDIEGSAGVYESALHIAPDVFSYGGQELRNKTIIRMNIAVDLASLYHKYPSLDHHGRKFRGLVQELFNEKAMHYAKRDLGAIQRSHTVLGLIYAERGQWESDWRPANAIFQLEHALGTAQRRFEENPKNLQTLPHLQNHLAKGYAEVGRRKEAYNSYVNAAVGYLDLDDLRQADQMLETAKAFSASAGSRERGKLREVEAILHLRQEIPQLQPNDFNPSSSGYYEKSAGYQWVSEPDKLRLDESFVNRQRFKALTDLGDQAARTGASSQALLLQIEALDVIEGESTLASMDDIVRLEQIKTTILENVRLRPREQVVGIGRGLEKNVNYANGRVWSVASPSQQRSLEVGVTQDLLLTSKIKSSMINESDSTAQAIKLYLREGRVTILQEQISDSIYLHHISTLIRDIPEVREVEISAEKK